MSETEDDRALVSRINAEINQASDRATLAERAGIANERWVQMEFSAPKQMLVTADAVRQVGYVVLPSGKLLWVYRLLGTDNAVLMSSDKRTTFLRDGQVTMVACVKVQQ